MPCDACRFQLGNEEIRLIISHHKINHCKFVISRVQKCHMLAWTGFSSQDGMLYASNYDTCKIYRIKDNWNFWQWMPSLIFAFLHFRSPTWCWWRGCTCWSSGGSWASAGRSSASRPRSGLRSVQIEETEWHMQTVKTFRWLSTGSSGSWWAATVAVRCSCLLPRQDGGTSQI